MYDTFIEKIRFDRQRYEICLPWKEFHPPLPDNRQLCVKRLQGLLRRLQQTPELLSEYDTIMRDQLSRGIIETVSQPSISSSDLVHYLPHHGVIRQDKSSTKLRIGISKISSGPSLNECLYMYTGPKFGQSLFDIILRFRLHSIALTGDIEKAFLMLSMNTRDRESLRFLWVNDIHADSPDIL